MTSVQDVLSVLEGAGFERLSKPLTVAGTEFDFEAAARGTQPSHDLVLIATDQVPRRRLQRLVAGLARSLDIAASRRPMSLVLMGEVAASDRIELERYARVLHIESTTPAIDEIEQAIADMGGKSMNTKVVKAAMAELTEAGLIAITRNPGAECGEWATHFIEGNNEGIVARIIGQFSRFPFDICEGEIVN